MFSDMDKELQNYYESAFSMMSTKGWADLMEDVIRIKNSYDTISSVTETHPLDFRRGQVDILNWLYGLKGSYEKTYDELTQEAL
jgi:hypothetical protein